MSTIHYMPLEPYQERYTAQLSAAKTGWLERKWLAHNVPYKRRQGLSRVGENEVKTGRVLDAVRRSAHAMVQTQELLYAAENGYLLSGDVIYLDDFWHPGIEAIPYTLDQLNLRCPVYAFCWAQSVDVFDFTYKMASWMRPFEKAIANYLSGIFVASTELKKLVVERLCVKPEKVHVVGLPFDSEEVMSRMPALYQDVMKGHPMAGSIFPRKNQVVFSSRWDTEKDPMFFLDVVEHVLAVRKDVKFVVCSSARTFRSNDPRLIVAAEDTKRRWPDNFEIRVGLTKEQYYATLCESKVQFNCADQDWVSFTLLEASVAGCWPVYPDYRSFPETLRYNDVCLYKKWDANDAVRLLLDRLDMNDSVFSSAAIRARAWIHERYDLTWLRMLNAMGLGHNVKDEELHARASEPLYTGG